MRSFSRSHELFERAKRVIPSGIPGHQSPGMLVAGASPCFVERAEGCRFWDVDGNVYIDYMCAYGPMIIGYNHPKVERAVDEQGKKGNCFNLPTPLYLRLAEFLVDLIPAADWAIFAKNGTDVTNYACRVARAHTGKRKIIMAAGSYHGIGSWCTPSPAGITPEDRAHMLAVPYNDAGGLRDLAAAHAEDLAGIILPPFRHDAFHDQELPTDAFLDAIREMCSAGGPVLILDDIRAGFRLHMGGSAEYFGLRPQLTCFSKAMANGYPLSACVGARELMDSASRVFFTGSFFTSALPMAAALATLSEMVETNAVAHLFEMGEMLRQGILEQAQSLELEIHYTGPPTMPFMTFAGDASWEKAKTFCARAYQEGVFFHPHHNWFISAAHQREDIEQTLIATRLAFEEVKEKFG